MYNIANIVIKPLLFLLKYKNNNNSNVWRDLSKEKMVNSYEELINQKKYNFKQIILLIFLYILSLLLMFNFRKKNTNQKKVSGTYYPIN